LGFVVVYGAKAGEPSPRFQRWEAFANYTIGQLQTPTSNAVGR